MSFIPGKITTPVITGKITLFEPTANGNKRKAGALDVTCKKLSKTDFEELRDGFDDDMDLNLCRELITDIKGAMKEDGSPWLLSDGLLDAMYQVDWQFNPIVDFMLSVNNERIGRALKAKN